MGNMIPAQLGWVARFKMTAPNGETYFMHEAIHAWDENGVPLIIPDDGRRLTPATNFANYMGICQDPHPGIVSMTPANGWVVRYKDQSGDWSQSVIGWALRTDGVVMPVTVDDNDEVGEVDCTNESCGVYAVERES